MDLEDHREWLLPSSIFLTLLTILTRYRAKATINPQAFHVTDGLRDAIREQAKIGWHNFILGRWTYKWKIVQKAHYDRIGSRKTPKRWLTAILRKSVWTCGSFATRYYMRLLGL